MMQSSRILGEQRASEQAQEQLGIKVGDGAGRPLFAFSSVDVPEKSNATNKTCILVTPDTELNSLMVEDASGGIDKEVIAWGCFTDLLATTGWNNLQLTSSDDNKIPLSVRAYSAGVVEGLLTYDQTT